MSKDKSTFNNRAIPFKETRKRRHFVLIEAYTMLIATLAKMHGRSKDFRIEKKELRHPLKKLFSLLLFYIHSLRLR